MEIIDVEYTQEYVDALVSEAEEKASICDNEEVAISLLKDISQLSRLSDKFFVPDIVFSWEEMALSYIESERAVFESVYYPDMRNIYDSGIEALRGIEHYTLDDAISKEVLFLLLHNFNKDVDQFNQACKRYGFDLFSHFQLTDNRLAKEYKDFVFGDNNG